MLDQFFKPEESVGPDDGEEEEEEEERAKEEVGLYRMEGNEKDDGEGEEVVEEGGEYPTSLRTNPDYEDEGEDKPEEAEYEGWEDAFEQEV